MKKSRKLRKEVNENQDQDQRADETFNLLNSQLNKNSHLPDIESLSKSKMVICSAPLVTNSQNCKVRLGVLI